MQLLTSNGFSKKEFFLDYFLLLFCNELLLLLLSGGAFRWRFTCSIDLELTIFLQSNYESIYIYIWVMPDDVLTVRAEIIRHSIVAMHLLYREACNHCKFALI